MKPLHWPDSYQPEPKEPKTPWESSPLIGWLFSSDDSEPIISKVKEQLVARPKPSDSLWGDDPDRLRMASYVCSVVKEEYEWPNDHFLPDDPFDIVFQVPWDDLEIVEFALRVEEDLGFEVKDEEARTWGGTLSNIIDFLVAKQKQARQT